MTPNEIVHLIRGLATIEQVRQREAEAQGPGCNVLIAYDLSVEQAAKLVLDAVEAEREACATIAENYDDGFSGRYDAAGITEVIRARGNK